MYWYAWDEVPEAFLHFSFVWGNLQGESPLVSDRGWSLLIRVRVRVRVELGELDGWVDSISSLFINRIYKDFTQKSLYILLHNTLRQAGAYTSFMLSLLQMNCTWHLSSGLVNKSTSWLVEDTCFSSIIPTSYFLCTTWLYFNMLCPLMKYMILYNVISQLVIKM